ncbi:hypothetical protein Aph02nite_40530 [Actinoplanes philippinensis]|uniref:Excreted virulence factor EspC, type VII ESX diderm n=1 Tax=Actinoplanes philippinensis TaxID=35752 RepID=A0A1I2GV28_9ACTN|nr:hypothetical protein [Actinoplanes philippinensis]GIE78103.1 hypothetical protein Aph02nite_40530 [Actinoplanes philippinensis]SFF21000.1 hypothetical protein SAMN05421541_107184 [Actinoplanes philippinensis]
MGVKKHVTSEAITGLAKELDTKVTDQITVAKRSLEGCEVGFPAFGLLGAVSLQPVYSSIIDDFRDYMTAFQETVHDISTILRTKTAPAWEAAEDTNTQVLYGDK